MFCDCGIKLTSLYKDKGKCAKCYKQANPTEEQKIKAMEYGAKFLKDLN